MKTFLAKLKEKHAVYHHNCVSNFRQKVKRKLNKKDTEKSSSSNKRTKRSDSQSINLGELKCLFCMKEDIPSNLCAGGTQHATIDSVNEVKNRNFTDKLWSRAAKLDDTRILNFLSAGSAAARELNYHLACLSEFYYKYDKKISQEIKESSLNLSQKYQAELHFRKIIEHIIDQRHLGVSVFAVNPLEKMYAQFLCHDNIPYTPHVTRFAERLKHGLLTSYRNNNGVEVRTIERSVKLCFSSDIDEIIERESTPSTLVESIINVIAPIRNSMSKMKNNFANSFPPNSQDSSVPIELQVLCSLLIDGCDPQLKGFSQSSKTVSQLIMYQYRKNSSQSTNLPLIRRHSKERETPVPLYVGLKLYAAFRSKTIIQRFFSLGMSISYDRCISICNNIGLNLLKNYESDGVFVSSNLNTDTFTIFAKDNIDLNACSTKIKQHFHGTSMTAMQFPSDENPGKKQNVIYDLSLIGKKTHLSLPNDYAIVNSPPYTKNTPLFSPVCTINIDYLDYTNDYFTSGIESEISWLRQCYEQTISWSSYHSESDIPSKTGIHSLMPLISEKVNTLKSQYHCMSIIKKTSYHLNSKQVPIDTSDQPVFALSKEVQLRYPSTFGHDKYICLLGDLHLEHSLLLMHGSLIKGSGLDSILHFSKLSTEGTSAIVDANDIKRSRYCLQVSVVVIYKLLREAHVKSESSMSEFEWLDEISKTSEMCFYWKMIINFQIKLLVFIRAIREGNFKLYLEVLFELLPWFFALDRYNYARWATINWFDLVLLEKRCPNEYQNLLIGNFSFLKTPTKFSRMSLDQLHEQNNKYIKSVSGATSLINRQDDSSLVRWELCGPELSRILQEFETIDTPVSQTFKKHHEDNETFNKDFLNDTATLYNNFLVNPFMLKRLTVVNNPEIIFEENVYFNLTQLETTGKKQVKTFIKDRLITSKHPITAKISLNHFILPGSTKSTKQTSFVDKRLTNSFTTKLRAAITYRRQHAKILFSSEIYGYSQCLSSDSLDMYHGTKSSILQRFNTATFKPTSASSAIIIELSPMLRKINHTGTFDDYSTRIFDEIKRLSVSYSRVDVVCDRYFPHSLKNQTRSNRGMGSVVPFQPNSLLPGNFNETFLKSKDNKERLNIFLAQSFHRLHQEGSSFTVTKGETILSNDPLILNDQSLSNNSAEEADQKLVRHMIQCVRSEINECLIRTIDTDVIISLISYRHHAGHLYKNVFACLTTAKPMYFNINEISEKLGKSKCRALPFFYSFTGCDIVSSFFNQGKCKFWDRWEESDEEEALTNTFIELSEKPSSVEEESISLLERYVGFVYYGKQIESLNLERLLDFEHSTHGNLKLIPPSRSGLKEHIKRSAYFAGWINYQCVENVILPEPSAWGWKLSGE